MSCSPCQRAPTAPIHTGMHTTATLSGLRRLYNKQKQNHQARKLGEIPGTVSYIYMKFRITEAIEIVSASKDTPSTPQEQADSRSTLPGTMLHLPSPFLGYQASSPAPEVQDKNSGTITEQPLPAPSTSPSLQR